MNMAKIQLLLKMHLIIMRVYISCVSCVSWIAESAVVSLWNRLRDFVDNVVVVPGPPINRFEGPNSTSGLVGWGTRTDLIE